MPHARGAAVAGSGLVNANSAMLASTTYDYAYTKTAWIDPVNITITSVTPNIQYPISGSGRWVYYGKAFRIPSLGNAGDFIRAKQEALLPVPVGNPPTLGNLNRFITSP